MADNVFGIGKRCPLMRSVNASNLDCGSIYDKSEVPASQLGIAHCGICPELPLQNPQRGTPCEQASDQGSMTMTMLLAHQGSMRHDVAEDQRNRKASNVLPAAMAAHWEGIQRRKGLPSRLSEDVQTASHCNARARSSGPSATAAVVAGAHAKSSTTEHKLVNDLSVRLGDLLQQDLPNSGRLTQAGLNQYEVLLEIGAYLDQLKRSRKLGTAAGGGVVNPPKSGPPHSRRSLSRPRSAVPTHRRQPSVAASSRKGAQASDAKTSPHKTEGPENACYLTSAQAAAAQSSSVAPLTPAAPVPKNPTALSAALLLHPLKPSTPTGHAQQVAPPASMTQLDLQTPWGISPPSRPRSAQRRPQSARAGLYRASGLPSRREAGLALGGSQMN